MNSLKEVSLDLNVTEWKGILGLIQSSWLFMEQSQMAIYVPDTQQDIPKRIASLMN